MKPLVAVSSPFHGYKNAYNDTEYNRKKARGLSRSYWLANMPAIILVLASDHLSSPYSPADNEQALGWCLVILEHCDEVHFHFPREFGLSAGMKGEEKLAKTLDIKCRYFPQEKW